jgi:hypothetical protein
VASADELKTALEATLRMEDHRTAPHGNLDKNVLFLTEIEKIESEGMPEGVPVFISCVAKFDGNPHA